MFPCARFDDHTVSTEHAFALRGLQEEIIARRIDEVIPALRRVERAADEGLWAAGYVAYEAAPAFDRALTVRKYPRDDPFAHLPLVWFAIFERREEYVPLGPRPNAPAPYHVSAWKPEIDQEEYDDHIERIRSHIAAGDTYQVNHTFRLRSAFSGDCNEFYRDLVLSQRSAYAANFDVGRYRVLSASPEQFFRVRGNRITVRPMKGTMRRGRWSEEDRRLAQELAASEKDKAENLIIVDLLRNDLGRIAEFGSVRVEDLFALERYETVWHLTSEIGAEMRPDVTLVDVFTALFPSGSITGAPKPRTMKIIRDLEVSPRGVYTGAVGYLGPRTEDGLNADFNVAIRTVTIDLEEGIAEYGVGGGITWGSEPTLEYEEARLKAKLLRIERRPDFSVLETLRWDGAGAFALLDAHLDRLEESAEYFGFAVDRELASESLHKAVEGLSGEHSLRITVARGGEITVSEPERLFDQFVEEPPGEVVLHVAVSSQPVSSDNPFLYHKTTNRRVYEARAEEFPTADDVILVNERGEVTELTNANILVMFGGRWWTPRLDSGCLPGTYRAQLLAEGVCRERLISAHELASADQLAAVNSVRGWRRVEILE